MKKLVQVSTDAKRGTIETDAILQNVNINTDIITSPSNLISQFVDEKDLEKYNQIVDGLNLKIDFQTLDMNSFKSQVNSLLDLLDKNQSNTKMLYLALCKKAATKFNIKNINILERINEFQAKGPSKNKKVEVSLELVSQINALLPNQPWKPGVHKSIIKEVKCTNNEYFSAVNKLIEDGLRNKQVDGVVYDQDGNVISFDEDRVDSNTLELKNT